MKEKSDDDAGNLHSFFVERAIYVLLSITAYAIVICCCYCYIPSLVTFSQSIKH
jgi:hypothetical protein